MLAMISCNPKLSNGLRKNDLHRDVEIITTKGTMVIRLSDSTPQHRDNFLRLAKTGFYDSLLFHRVIRNFMIQTGDPDSREGHPGKPMSQGGSGGPGIQYRQNSDKPFSIIAGLWEPPGIMTM